MVANVLAFSLGVGMFKVTLALVLWFGFLSFARLQGAAKETTSGELMLIGILALFLFSYWYFYIPYYPSKFGIETHYFKIVLIVSVATVLLPLLAGRSDKGLLELIWYLCLGAFAYAALTVSLTLILKDPPYYGQIVDIRALARGNISYGNTPGIANLLTLMPTVFLAGFLLPNHLKPRWFWSLGPIGLFLSIGFAVAIQQRSFFTIGIFLQPLVVCLLMIVCGRIKAGIIVLMFLSIYPLLLLADSLIGTGFFYRKVDGSMLLDARLLMLESWGRHFLVDPQIRQAVPAQWNYLQHFHNFFSDIHRVSGLWALVAALALVVFGFVRVFWLIVKSPPIGSFLLAVAIPAFLIMMTSVVPEGEKQPMLVFLLVAAVCERYLCNIRKKLLL